MTQLHFRFPCRLGFVLFFDHANSAVVACSDIFLSFVASLITSLLRQKSMCVLSPRLSVSNSLPQTGHSKVVGSGGVVMTGTCFRVASGQRFAVLSSVRLFDVARDAKGVSDWGSLFSAVVRSMTASRPSSRWSVSCS